MANYRDDYDGSSQWASVGQSSWSNPVGTLGDQSDQWQGQAGQYHDLTQTYYDPDDPQAWRQGAYRGPGPKKPPYRLWWFWAIIVIVLLGLLAIVVSLLPSEAADDSAPSTGPNSSLIGLGADEDILGGAPSDLDRISGGSEIQRDGESFELSEPGTAEDALIFAQERVNAEYQHYGPADLVSFLRSEGFQNDAIEYALNNVEVDWNAQALGVAQRLADSEHGGSSQQQLHDNLVRSSFSDNEIDYALDNVEIDYNKQALQELESYLELFGDDTEAEAREYLERAEFESAQIDYAFDNVD
jgi:hypothetical protein